ncbi:hypothetical protein BDN67DRAFT_1056501, partial [Paxillus ammoniavirescens]
DEERSQREEARDDEEGQDVEETPNKEEEGQRRDREQLTATNTNKNDALHDPGGETVAPGSVPPSVRLEGERKMATSLYVEVNEVETVNNHVEEDHDDQKPPKDPVGMTDGNEHHPTQPDVTETVQDYWGSVPEPPDPRTKSTEAHTSTLYTVNTTHTANYHIG